VRTISEVPVSITLADYAASCEPDKEPQPIATKGVEGCQHHWLIDAQNKGTCKFCGEVRQFGQNYVAPWNKKEMDHWMNRRRKPGKREVLA